MKHRILSGLIHLTELYLRNDSMGIDSLIISLTLMALIAIQNNL